MVKIAINGFGRIGRCALKILLDRRDVEVVAINDHKPLAASAYLLSYDTAYGIYGRKVSYDEKTKTLSVNTRKIPVFQESDPAKLSWGKLDVDVVLECTGQYTDPDKAKIHLKSGARKVVISAPAKKTSVKTVVLGVNEDVVVADDQIISAASCTTSCIAPVMKILEDNLGIEKAMMTTVHSYTASQRLQDGSAKDFREGRAGAENIIPTSTGASKATALTIPALKNRFAGLSVRVPTLTVSLADITAVVKTDTTIEDINKIFKRAAKEPYYEGIVGVTEEPLVSSDFKGDARSAIVDLSFTDVVGDNLIKVLAWYDNEWGYANRLVELAVDFGKVSS